MIRVSASLFDGLRFSFERIEAYQTDDVRPVVSAMG